jgi:hypothetical protein
MYITSAFIPHVHGHWSTAAAAAATATATTAATTTKTTAIQGDRCKTSNLDIFNFNIEWRPLGFEKIGGLNSKSQTSKVKYFDS